jgi:hypothetical protein
MVEYVILPTITSSSPAIVRQQEEVAEMLFDLLASQQRWVLVHLLILKSTAAMQASSGGLPPALSHRLASLVPLQHSMPDHAQVLLRGTKAPSGRAKRL